MRRPRNGSFEQARGCEIRRFPDTRIENWPDLVAQASLFTQRQALSRLRIDFTTLREAAAFDDDLGGSVRGAKRMDQAAD